MNTFVLAEVTYADRTVETEILDATSGEIEVGLTGCNSILSARRGSVRFTAMNATGETIQPGEPLKLRY